MCAGVSAKAANFTHAFGPPLKRLTGTLAHRAGRQEERLTWSFIATATRERPTMLQQCSLPAKKRSRSTTILSLSSMALQPQKQTSTGKKEEKTVSWPLEVEGS